jgi:hypothetical protein
LLKIMLNNVYDNNVLNLLRHLKSYLFANLDPHQ